MVLNHSIPGLVGFVIFVILFSTIAIGLRLWSRAVSPNVRFWWDDWLVFAAWPFALGICGLVLNASRWGLGMHAWELPAYKNTHLLQLLYAGDVLFDLSISCSRLSALAFYGRVFRVRTNPNKAWRIWYWIITGLAIAWPIASIPYTIAQCSPVWKFWLPDTPGNCFGVFDNFISSAVTNVIIDILILILPIPQIIQLRLPLRRKLLVVGTFILGYSVVFMSIGRLISAGQAGDTLTTDVPFATTPILYWITAECSLSIVAVCLPAIFQLYKRVHAYGLRSLLSSRDFSKLDDHRGVGMGSTGPRSDRADGRSGASRNNWSFRRLFDRSGTRNTDAESNGTSYDYMVHASTASVGDHRSDVVPLDGIQVRRDYDTVFMPSGKKANL